MPVCIRADQRVRLTAATSGFAEGTTATFKIFRLGREEDGDEIDSLTAQTDAEGRAAVEWAYEPEPEERGEFRFVHRCEMEGQWLESDVLIVAVPDLHAAAWNRDEACVGDAVELQVACPALPPDRAVRFEIRNAADDAVLETLDAQRREERATARWTLPDADPGAPVANLYFLAKSGDLECASWSLLVHDAAEVVLVGDDGTPLAGVPVTFRLADGRPFVRKTDAAGRARLEGVSPGAVSVSVPGVADDELRLQGETPLRGAS